MGKKTKKTKWRMLEIPPFGVGKTNESTTITATTTTTTTTATATATTTTTAITNNGKWENGQRAPFANYFKYDKTTTASITNPASARRLSSRTNSPSNVTGTGNSLSYISNVDAFTMKEDSKTSLIEDEYTKITTPRQDVLFKKGYLSKRKIPETISENSVDQNSDDIAQDCTNNEDFSQYVNGDETLQTFVCPTPQSYIDPSALYYGGSYEIYDPFTGNVTVVMGPPANGQYPSNSSCQPLLTSVPCRPVPLQPVQWFNPVPSSDWCCSYSSGPQNDKKYSTDSQNGGSGMSSESSGITDNSPELMDEQISSGNGNGGGQGSSFSPSYVYPGYMFGTPIYTNNVDGVNVVQYLDPSSPTPSYTEQVTSKRKKKRKRRRRTGETAEDETESSFDDNCNHSVSSNDCMLDFQSPASSESLEYEDDHKTVRNLYNDHSSIQNGQLVLCTNGMDVVSDTLACPIRFSSLPYNIVNAPEFVPAEEHRSFKPSSTVCDTTNRIENDTMANSKKSSVGLNVYCKPFDSRSIKHDSQRVSSSNNSDSGISSPGSEDISKGDFVGTDRTTSVEDTSTTMITGNVTGKKKHSRAKRSKKTEAAAVIEEAKKQKTVKETTTTTTTSGQKMNQQSGKNVDAKKEKSGSKKDEETNNRSKLTRGRKKFDDEFVVESVFKSGAKLNESRTGNGHRKKETSKNNGGRCKKMTNRNHSPKFESVDEVNQRVRVFNSFDLKETNDKKFNDNTSILSKISSDDEILDKEQTEKCGNCDSKCVNGGDIEDDRCIRRLQTQCLQHTENNVWSRDDRKEETQTMLNDYVNGNERPMSVKLVESDEAGHRNTDLSLKMTTMLGYSSCRETLTESPTAPPRQKKSTRKCVEETAQSLVDEIIKCAEERIVQHSSTTCDKTFQLPITQAVTKWLNEHGGLPAVSTDEESETEDETDCNRKDNLEKITSITSVQSTARTEMTTTSITNTNNSGSAGSETIKLSKKSKQNCVIC